MSIQEKHKIKKNFAQQFIIINVLTAESHIVFTLVNFCPPHAAVSLTNRKLTATF